MNRKSYLLIGLLAIVGVLFFLRVNKPGNEAEEKSDVVITIEQSPPVAEKKEQSPRPSKNDSNEKEDPEIEEFSLETRKTLNTLPTVQALQELPEKDVHHTPQILREASEKIADAISRAEASPKLRPEALRFLKGCAETQDSAPSIRALCWNKLLQNIPRWKVFIPISDADVPQDIKDLASRL